MSESEDKFLKTFLSESVEERVSRRRKAKLLLASKKDKAYSEYQKNEPSGEKSEQNPTPEVLQYKESVGMSQRIDDVRRISHKAIDTVRNAFNDQRFRKFVIFANDALVNYAPFIEKPTLWNGLKASAGFVKALSDESSIWPDGYFSGTEWTCPYERGFVCLIIEVLEHLPKRIINTSDENEVIYIIENEGIRYGWQFNTKSKAVDRVYVDIEHVVAGRAFIKKLLWEKYGGKPLILSKKNFVHGELGAYNDSITIEYDDTRPPLPSKFSEQYSNYLKRALDMNINRSVLLYGPPGTGKSTIAREIVSNLSLKSFRVRVEDLANFGNSLLFDSINIFEPDAIILDDFDRVSQQAQLLETLDFFQRHVKLTIATVNDPNQLDEALKRPERFDEMVLIERIDEDVVRHVLGEFADAYDFVKEWPITFINEYVKRRKFMTADETEKAMIELANRVSRLKTYSEKYSDISAILKPEKDLTVEKTASDEDDDDQEEEEK